MTSKNESRRSTAKVCLCRGGVIAGLLSAGVFSQAQPVYAQAVPNAAADESLTQKSRELFEEGNAYSAKGDFVRARAALKAAWGLMHHWGIAANLGAAELELGHHRDATELLAFALRDWPEQHWHEELKAVRAAFQQARGYVGAVEVKVDVAGATVVIDGVPVGEAPLPDKLFVEPGKHVVSAKAPRLGMVQSEISVDAGGTASVSLRLEKPAKESTPTGAKGNSRSTEAIVLGAGAALTLISAGTALLYHNKASRADDNIERYQARRDATLGPNGCGVSARPSLCDQLNDEFDARDSARRAARFAWVGAGVAAGATVAAYFLWPRDEAGATSVVPTVWKNSAFISLEGRF